MRHHTATHLLHAALKHVLGEQVHQAGSLVGPTELRFDFNFVRSVTSDELDRIETLVNERILANQAVSHREMAIADAREEGAMALFGEKYGDVVRVIDVPGFSKELCGGTHVTATGSIGAFKIVREEGIAAGVRRIQAVAGDAAVALVRDRFRVLERACEALKSAPEELPERLDRLQDKLKESDAIVRDLRTQLAIARTSALVERAEVVGSARVLVQQVQDLESDALRAAAEHLVARLGSAVVVLASATAGKVALVAAVAPALIAEGAHAGKLVGQVLGAIGGKGGGKPQLAPGGGGDADRLPAALGQAWTLIKDQLKIEA
jgi:alanyl-tRNA synthetase